MTAQDIKRVLNINWDPMNRRVHRFRGEASRCSEPFHQTRKLTTPDHSPRKTTDRPPCSAFHPGGITIWIGGYTLLFYHIIEKLYLNIYKKGPAGLTKINGITTPQRQYGLSAFTLADKHRNDFQWPIRGRYRLDKDLSQNFL